MVGNAPDVIFMAVGHDHAANPLLVFAQIAGVGQHHVDAMHAIAGEGETAIHQHQVIAIFKNAGVFTNLMQTAEGNDPQDGLFIGGLGTAGAGNTGDRIGWAHWGKGKGRERDAGLNATPPDRCVQIGLLGGGGLGWALASGRTQGCQGCG